MISATFVSGVSQVLNLLRHLSTLWKKPSPNIMLHLFNSIVRPIFEYGSVGYVNAAEVHMEKLQLIQNQALRIVTKSPQYISIKDLHDCTGSLHIRNHLILHARRRLHTMKQNSPIIHEVMKYYEKVKHIKTNPSTLDVISR